MLTCERNLKKLKTERGFEIHLSVTPEPLERELK